MVLTKPSVENNAKAMAYTSTQLIKFGIVVKVCTKRRNLRFLISFKKMAKAMAHQLVAIPRPLMANVFFSTRTTSAFVASL